MNITLETQPNCRAILRIEIPAADVQQQRERVTGDYARQARIPGFRPGKAPKQVVAKRYEREIGEEVENALVRLGYQEAEKRDDMEILNVVGVRDQSLHPDNHFTFTLEVSTVPKFELPNYKGIPVKLPRVDVTDADIDHDLLHLRERYQTFQDVDREAKLGDYVVLHATGTVDGTPIAEAHPDAPAFLKKIEGNWFELTEEEKFLPGFFAALVGIKKDETREVFATLPEEFGYEPLKGKTIVMQVKCDTVKEAQLPELNDDFAKQVNKDWDLERLRTEVRIGITHRREQSRDNAKSNQVIQHLAEKLEFELPQDLVNREAQRRTNDIAMNAMRQGMEQDRIMEVQDQIVSAATQQARQNVKVSFILGEVAKRENLSVREEQLRQAIARIASQQRVQPKKLLADGRKTGLIERLQEDILLENAVQFLKDNAAVEEVEPEKEDCGHDHGH
jgi:trigger factor